VRVARFIADQRTEHQVPHALSCRVLGVSASWFYKWLHRPVTPRQVRRAELDAAVRKVFDGSRGTYGCRGCAPSSSTLLRRPARGRCVPRRGGCR
jgi:putative transposase